MLDEDELLDFDWVPLLVFPLGWVLLLLLVPTVVQLLLVTAPLGLLVLLVC